MIIRSDFIADGWVFAMKSDKIKMAFVRPTIWVIFSLSKSEFQIGKALCAWAIVDNDNFNKK